MLDKHGSLPGPNQSQTNQRITELWLCYLFSQKYLLIPVPSYEWNEWMKSDTSKLIKSQTPETNWTKIQTLTRKRQKNKNNLKILARYFKVGISISVQSEYSIFINIWQSWNMAQIIWITSDVWHTECFS